MEELDRCDKMLKKKKKSFLVAKGSKLRIKAVEAHTFHTFRAGAIHKRHDLPRRGQTDPTTITLESLCNRRLDIHQRKGFFGENAWE